MAIFKELLPQDIKTSKTSLYQLVDIAGSDISSSLSRKSYDVWSSGSFTGSMFQTVYDGDYSLAASNAVFDVTIGLHSQSTAVTMWSPSTDDDGLLTFPSYSLQMNEKIANYQQMAQLLLGDKDSTFVAPFGSTDSDDEIKEALFFCFKRLFARDEIKRQTYTAYMYASASTTDLTNVANTGEQKYTVADESSLSNKLLSYGGKVSNINIASPSTVDESPGLLFVDMGIAVLDMKRVFDGSQVLSGAFSSAFGIEAISASFLYPTGSFVGSASIDDVVRHVCSTRFVDTSNSQMEFQNITYVNTAYYFCQASADEFNYSSNPTFVDSNTNDIVVIKDSDTDKTFSYITSVGLYDASNNLLAVGKASRPILKDDTKALILKLRLDF